MCTQTCEDCSFYIQHYALIEGKLQWVYCGHCTKCRLKIKRPDREACAHYVAGKTMKSEFVTKQYLTRKLLEYVLNMELIPEELLQEKT